MFDIAFAFFIAKKGGKVLISKHLGIIDLFLDTFYSAVDGGINVCRLYGSETEKIGSISKILSRFNRKGGVKEKGMAVPFPLFLSWLAAGCSMAGYVLCTLSGLD